MKYRIIAFIALLAFPPINLAKEVTLVVPQNIIGGINHGIKITSDNMAVRKFNKEDYPGEYLIEKDFNSAINQTVDRPIQAGQPIPIEAIVPLWQKYTSDTAGFTIMVPGETMTKEVDGTNESWMPDRSEVFLVVQGDLKLKQGLHTYQIVYAEYSENNVADPGKDNILKKSRELSLEYLKEEGVEIKHMEESDISLNGHPGQEMNLIVDDGEINMHLFLNTYQVGNLLYSLTVTSIDNPAPKLDRQRFFDSFKIINP